MTENEILEKAGEKLFDDVTTKIREHYMDEGCTWLYIECYKLSDNLKRIVKINDAVGIDGYNDKMLKVEMMLYQWMQINRNATEIVVDMLIGIRTGDFNDD
jgi:hypothetical protein